MRRIISSTLAVTVLLAGCASPASQQNLFALQQQCAAGNPDACTAANFQAQANQQEAAQNAQAFSTGLAILGGAAILAGGIAASNNYHPHHYRGW